MIFLKMCGRETDSRVIQALVDGDLYKGWVVRKR